MATVFCRVTADLSEEFVQLFPHQFDFHGLLERIAEDAGVTVSSSDSRIQNATAYCLQGLWPGMEKAYNMLVCVHGSMTSLRCEQESAVLQGSRPFSALVEAAEAISRGADFQEQVENEVALIKHSLMKESLRTLDDGQIQEPAGQTRNLNDANGELNSAVFESADNFTKFREKEEQRAVLNLESAEIRGHERLIDTEDLEYAEKRPFSDLKDSAENELTRKAINEEIGQEIQCKKETTLNPKLVRVLRSSDSTRVSDSDSKKIVLVKKKQTRGSVKEKTSPEHRTVVQKKKTPSKVKSEKDETCANQLKVSSMVSYEPKPVQAETEKTGQKKTPLVVQSSVGTQSGTGAENLENLSCEYCDFVAVNRKAFSDHTQRLHLAKPSKCDVCDKVFPNERYMKRHRDTHGERSHRCGHCGKVYKVQKALRNHVKKHDINYKPPEFQCDMCQKSFCNSYILECHKKSEHLGLKRSFLCSTCGKSFTTKHTLQQHVNVHIGARPYKCDKCDKAFCYESALRDHKFIHDGIKKFICSDPLCNKAFRQRSALKMHEKIHRAEKEFVCSECGRGFTQKQALQRHIRAHKGDKPFWCKLCLRSFGDAAIIRRHMILVHKIHKDPSSWREDIVLKVPVLEEESNDKTDNQMETTADGPIRTTLESAEADSVVAVTQVENQHVKKQGLKTPSKMSVSQGVLPSVSEVNNRYNKAFECVPVQILQVPVADHYQTADFPTHKGGANVDNSPQDIAGHYPVNVLQPNVDSHGEVLNYEYIVTDHDDTPYEQLARASEIDHTDYTKAPLADKAIENIRITQMAKNPKSQELDTGLGLVDTVTATHLTDGTREIALPEVSTVFAGTSSQDDLPAVVPRSFDQTVTGTRQEVLTAEKIIDIAKRLQEVETVVTDNQQIQALYSYYSALASQYYNVPVAQYNSSNQE